MKRISLLTILIAVCSIMASGQRAAHNHGSDQRYGVEEQLIKLDKEWGAASARADMKTLDRILANNYTYTDLDGRVGNKVEMFRDMKASQAMGVEALESSDYQVKVYGNTAVMTHVTTSSQDPKVRLQSMHVWVKKGPSWQVVAHQWTAITPRNSNVPDFRARCAKYSYEPEVIAYFGNSDTVISKLDNDKMGLPDRRGYLLLVETKDSAEFSFFEKADEQHFRVSQWRGQSLGDLREALTNVILENRGIACVGAQTKSIINARFSPGDLGSIPTPLSARAAFSHILKKHGNDDYLRVTILLLC